MDGSALRTGCWTLIICGIISLVLGLGLFALIDSFKDYDHCKNCGRQIHDEKYCPNCGTPTDSVATYNYWEGRKLNK